jgi:hypothetical protein
MHRLGRSLGLSPELSAAPWRKRFCAAGLVLRRDRARMIALDDDLEVLASGEDEPRLGCLSRLEDDDGELAGHDLPVVLEAGVRLVEPRPRLRCFRSGCFACS